MQNPYANMFPETPTDKIPKVRLQFSYLRDWSGQPSYKLWYTLVIQTTYPCDLDL